MAEPTTTASLTFIAATVSVPAITVLGIPLGLRPDLLIAGFGGSLVAIILLNSVPTRNDTWRELIRTTIRRMSVACASSLTAGYFAPVMPLVPLLGSLMSDPVLLGTAFGIGGGAQEVLRFVIRKLGGGGVAAQPAAPEAREEA